MRVTRYGVYMNNTATTATTTATEALLDFATDIAFEHCLSIVADGINCANLTHLRFIGACDKLEALGVPQDIGIAAATKGYQAFQAMQRDIAAGDDFIASLTA